MPFADPPRVRYDNSQMPPPPNSGPGTFVPPDHGDPPPTFRGFEWDGESGEMSFSCEFSLTATYTRNIDAGYATTAGGEVFTGNDNGAGVNVTTGLGINFTVDILASGQCGVGISTRLAALDHNIFLGSPFVGLDSGAGGNPYDTGSSFIEDVHYDGTLGHRYCGSPLLQDYGPCASASNSATGRFSCYVRAAEYKGVSVDVRNGQGEPNTDKAKAAFAFPKWEWGYSIEINCPSPPVITDYNKQTNGPYNQPWPLSGGYAVGERYVYSHDAQGHITGMSVVYDTQNGNGSPVFFQPEAWADVSIGGNTASCTNMNFSSGPWTPVPYSGRRASDAPGSSVSVDVGKVVCVNNTVHVMAASSTPAHLIGRVYRGDTLYPGVLRAQFGSYVPAGSGVVGASSLRDVEIVDGKIDIYLPQIRCIYYGHQVVFDPLPDPAAATVWVPPLPLNRDDYNGNSMQLYPLNQYVNEIKFLDDYSWVATTFHQARQTKVEDFADVSGWTARGGTVASGPGLKMTGGAANFRAQSPASFSGGRPSSSAHPLKAWDCRNYRYMQMTVDSSGDGGPLTLTLDGGGRVFKTPSLKAGSNTLVIDLCNPIGYTGLGLTRTGWDKQPDDRYGVMGITVLQIEGVANGQTVTLHDLTLIRKDEAAPGYVCPETTALSTATVTSWYKPDRPYEDFTCGQNERPDDVFSEMTYANHTYARILRTYSDGKPAADLPHAIGRYPWYVDSPNNTRLKGYIIDAERLSVAAFVDMVNATQTGLSCTPAQDGDRLYWYKAVNTHAIWLTRDNYYLADGIPDKLDAPALTAPPSANLDGAQLRCRMQFNSVKSYPGQFTPVEYAFCKRMHWVYDGTVVIPDGSSAKGAVVTLTPCSDFLHEGPLHVKADKNGYFRFPFVGNSLSTLKTGDSSWQVYGHERATCWIGLTGQPPAYGGQPSYDVSETGRHVRAYVSNASFNVVIGTSPGPVPVTLSWTDAETNIGDTWPVARWERRARQPRLFLISKSGDSNDINLRWSVDEGRSWTLTTFNSSSAATTATLAETEHGLKYVYYRTTIGAIKGQILDAQLNVVQGEFSVIGGGVDDTGIAAREFQTGGGRWHIGLQYVSEGRVVYVSSVDGINFS